MAVELETIASGYNTSKLNSNFEKIQDSINNDTLKREVTTGEANEMRTHLDMNTNRIVNCMDGVDPQDAVTVHQLGSILDPEANAFAYVYLAAYMAGVLRNQQTIFTFVCPYSFTLVAGLTLSIGYAEVPATADATLSIQKDNYEYGTVNFAAGENTPTFTFTSDVSFVKGDRLEIVGQAIADATLSDVAITLGGTF